MGVRPAIYYIIGASGVTGERTVKGDIYEDAIPMSVGDMVISDGQDTFGHRVYNLDNVKEYAVKGVVGYQLSDGSDEDIARALRMCFPDIFSDDGFREIPTREMRYHEKILLERGNGMMHRDTYKAVKFCADYGLFYEWYDSFTTWYEFETAQTVLKLAGWDFPFSRLKRMLVWNWT